MWQKLRAKASFLEPALSLPERQLHVLEGARPQTPAAPGSLSALPLPSGSPGASASPLLTYQMGWRTPTYSLEPGLGWGCSCPGIAPYAQDVLSEWELNHNPLLYLPVGVGQTCHASRYCPKHSSPTAGLCSGCPPTWSDSFLGLSHPVWYFLLVFQKKKRKQLIRADLMQQKVSLIFHACSSFPSF